MLICVLVVREGGDGSRSKVAHEASSMSGVENPANTFGKSIAGVDGAFDVLEEDMSSTFQSWMAKYWMSMCWEHSVGRPALTIFMADSLSS